MVREEKQIMSDTEPSEEDIKNFIESINWSRLLYLWALRAKGFQVNEQEIINLETDVYPDLQKYTEGIDRPLCQRDIDELQLILSLEEPQTGDRVFVTKAMVFRLYDITVRMWKEDNHQRPHFHIKYKNQYSGSYAVDTLERLAGDVPPKYEKPILEWAKQNRKSLKYTWYQLQAGKDIRELVSTAKTF